MRWGSATRLFVGADYHNPFTSINCAAHELCQHLLYLELQYPLTSDNMNPIHHYLADGALGHCPGGTMQVWPLLLSTVQTPGDQFWPKLGRIKHDFGASICCSGHRKARNIDMCFINFLDHERAVVAGEHLVKVGAVLRAMDFIFGIWGSMKTFSHTKRMIIFYIIIMMYKWTCRNISP